MRLYRRGGIGELGLYGWGEELLVHSVFINEKYACMHAKIIFLIHFCIDHSFLSHHGTDLRRTDGLMCKCCKHQAGN